MIIRHREDIDFQTLLQIIKGEIVHKSSHWAYFLSLSNDIQ